MLCYAMLHYAELCYLILGGTITGVGTGLGIGGEITGPAHITEMEVPLKVFMTESKSMRKSRSWHQLINLHLADSIVTVIVTVSTPGGDRGSGNRYEWGRGGEREREGARRRGDSWTGTEGRCHNIRCCVLTPPALLPPIYSFLWYLHYVTKNGC